MPQSAPPGPTANDHYPVAGGAENADDDEELDGYYDDDGVFNECDPRELTLLADTEGSDDAYQQKLDAFVAFQRRQRDLRKKFGKPTRGKMRRDPKRFKPKARRVHAVDVDAGTVAPAPDGTYAVGGKGSGKGYNPGPPPGVPQAVRDKRIPCPGCGSRWHLDCTKHKRAGFCTGYSQAAGGHEVTQAGELCISVDMVRLGAYREPEALRTHPRRHSRAIRDRRRHGGSGQLVRRGLGEYLYGPRP